MSTENNAIVNTETVINTPVENPVENPLPQEDTTVADNFMIQKLEKRIIDSCINLHNLKVKISNKEKNNNIIDDAPNYIQIYKDHKKCSRQYVKFINGVLRLDGIENEKNFNKYLHDKPYGIYKILFHMTSLSTLSTRKSYICAVRKVIELTVPDNDDMLSILSSEIGKLFDQINRQTRNKRNLIIKNSCMEHHNFIITELRRDYYNKRASLKKNTWSKQSELCSTLWILSWLCPIRPEELSSMMIGYNEEKNCFDPESRKFYFRDHKTI